MENPGLSSDNDRNQAAASTERSRDSQVLSIPQRIQAQARVCTQAQGVVGRTMSDVQQQGMLPGMQQGGSQLQLAPHVQQLLQQVQQGGGGQLPPANQQWGAGGPPLNPQQRPGMMGHMAAQQQPAVSQQQQQMMNQQQSQPGNRALMQVAGVAGGVAGANASLAAAAGAGSLPQAALQELLRTLRSPRSPLQQQQVLNILRSNPSLMAAFIRQRAARYQGGHGGVGGPQQGAPAGERFQGAAGGVPGVGGPGANQAVAAAERSRESRRLRVQRCIESMIHTVQCQNANCSLPSCQKMKYVLQHTKGCQRKANGSCPICRPFLSLCCYHANHCQDNICLVPLCTKIKRKLRQHRLQRAQRQRGNKTLNRG